MAKLSYKERKALPKQSFALPGKRKFPVEDKSHARNALARLNQAKGLSAEEKAKVKRSAYRVLGNKPK